MQPVPHSHRRHLASVVGSRLCEMHRIHILRRPTQLSPRRGVRKTVGPCAIPQPASGSEDREAKASIAGCRFPPSVVRRLRRRAVPLRGRGGIGFVLPAVAPREWYVPRAEQGASCSRETQSRQRTVPEDTAPRIREDGERVKTTCSQNIHTLSTKAKAQGRTRRRRATERRSSATPRTKSREETKSPAHKSRAPCRPRLRLRSPKERGGEARA